MTRVVNHQVDLPEVTATSRRRLLASLLAGGAAVAAAPLLAGRASAEGLDLPRDPKDFASLNNALKSAFTDLERADILTKREKQQP